MTTTQTENRPQRIKRLLTALLGIAMLATLFQVAAPMPEAEAYCDGKNRARSIWGAGGKEEVQYSSTCDGDGIYKGRVRNFANFGTLSVQTWNYDRGHWQTHASSRDGSGMRFTLWDQGHDLRDGRHFLEMRLRSNVFGSTGERLNIDF